MNAGPDYWDGVFRGFLSDQLVCLRSYIGELETELEFSQPMPEANQSGAVSKSPISRKVFIVHGHNDAIRESCARFLERLDLRPIILHEQPNAGRTIIEKFQDYADVGFAVVLLTADDKGGTKNTDPTALKPRARQNVIFELGFFIGKLGRSKVCALYENGVELPSDYNGVLFTPIDAAGTWKFQLCREIKAAGIDVDLNKAI
jgi:predicted nucleotide-binding protein